MSEPIAVVVPKDLYYHEIDYVRGLEARVANLEAALIEAQRYILQLGVPDKWGRELHAQIDAALKDAPQ